MSNYDRNTRLQILAQSRKATQQLSKLVLDPHCKMTEVQRCLAMGALVEDAYTHKDDPRGGSAVKISAIDSVLKHDRADIALAFVKAGGLDAKEFQSWTGSAIYHNAIQCLTAFIQGGLTQNDAPDIAQCMTAAAMKENPAFVERLLTAGVSSNIEHVDRTYSPTLYTSRPLHWATHVATAKTLLAAGAKINARNQHGKPPVGTLLERLNIHQGPQEKDIKASQALSETVCHLIAQGCQLELPGKQGQWHTWQIWDSLDRHDVNYKPIVEALVKRKDVDIKHLLGKVKSLSLLEALLDVRPDVPANSWISHKIWEHVSLSNDADIQRIEHVLECGVNPPKFYNIHERSRNGWLQVGIPITEADLERAEHDAYEQESRWYAPSDEAVAQSNAKALARIAKRAQTDTVRPTGRTAPKF